MGSDGRGHLLSTVTLKEARTAPRDFRFTTSARESKKQQNDAPGTGSFKRIIQQQMRTKIIQRMNIIAKSMQNLNKNNKTS